MVKKGVSPSSIILPYAAGPVKAWSHIRVALAGGRTHTALPDVMEDLDSDIPQRVIDYGTTNLTDWFLHSAEVENVVAGFLNGRTEPEIFFADDDRFSNLFIKDQIDLKVRMPVIAGAVDWVGVHGSNVA